MRIPSHQEGLLAALPRPSIDPRRYAEVDMLRGIALIMMVIFHTAFDLQFLGIVPLEVGSGPWRMLAWSTGGLFLFLVGVSLSLSAARNTLGAGRPDYGRFARRGLRIFAYGLVITATTALIIPRGMILFGILHCIGLSIILAPLFFRFGRYNLLIATAVIVLGWLIAPLNGPWCLLWSGIHPAGWTTLDYYPLLPWFGLVLAGYAAGTVCYPGGKRRPGIPAPDGSRWKGLVFLGQYSLPIYFVHQPVILGILIAAMAIAGGS